MKREPRNPRSDKLVNERLISMAYGQIGWSVLEPWRCSPACKLVSLALRRVKIKDRPKFIKQVQG